MRFKLTINQDHRLNNRMQHGKYLRLAKQTADQIQHVVLKSKAYCDIATEQAKTNPEAAKETADQIEDGYWKSQAYCAIATAQAKTNSVDANQTWILAKQTADQIEDVYWKSQAYCDIAAALLPR